MDIVSLLVIVLLLSYLIGKNNSPYARVVLGSMFGIFYFGIWRFTSFYLDLYQYKVLVREIIFLALMVGATLLALGLIRIKYVTSVAAISVLLFVASMMVTFSFEAPINSAITELSGFYKPVAPAPFVKGTDEQVFTQKTANYQVTLPSTWQLRSDKGPQFPYFQWLNQNKLLLEFRPRCFDSSKTTIPGILMTMRKTDKDVKLHTEFHCTKEAKNNTVACKANRYQLNGPLKRVEYFARTDQSSKGIELDFVLSQDSVNVKKAIDRVIDSMQPLPAQAHNNSRCLGLAEWM